MDKVHKGTRAQAVELAKVFFETVTMATGSRMDFYKLLWVVHWAVENHGEEKARETLESLLLDAEFKPENAAELFHGKILRECIAAEKVGEWFQRAMRV